jgi:hypothetical protein
MRKRLKGGNTEIGKRSIKGKYNEALLRKKKIFLPTHILFAHSKICEEFKLTMKEYLGHVDSIRKLHFLLEIIVTEFNFLNSEEKNFPDT